VALEISEAGHQIESAMAGFKDQIEPMTLGNMRATAGLTLK
jgi:hypothetical protein